MPLFVIGFCYSSPLACGGADAPGQSTKQACKLAAARANNRIERKDGRQ